jgi:hypothetical protein
MDTISFSKNMPILQIASKTRKLFRKMLLHTPLDESNEIALDKP